MNNRRKLVIALGAGATRAEEFCKGDEQVTRQKERIAHESNIITPASLRKTAQ
jgi:hypothetical protein